MSNENIIPELLEIIARYDKWGVITAENDKKTDYANTGHMALIDAFINPSE